MTQILAFTGPSGLTPAQEMWCREELRQLRRHNGLAVWRSGGAFGLDTLVVEESGVGQDVHLFVPQGKLWNSMLFQYNFAEVTYVPYGYRKRNEALVAGADVLHAFLRSPSFYRSGEWMTVNIARRAGIEIVYHIIP